MSLTGLFDKEWVAKNNFMFTGRQNEGTDFR